jgi:hypothetical protein
MISAEEAIEFYLEEDEQNELYTQIPTVDRPIQIGPKNPSMDDEQRK